MVDDRRGVTAIEYALVAAGGAAVIVVAVFTMGERGRGHVHRHGRRRGQANNS
ncbi:MAG: Flp family type IVb pilin [Alphaproteobacteria bacterium]|nr:Flp family type IVb pilin [Alphaproteobacteria bacterium]